MKLLLANPSFLPQQNGMAAVMAAHAQGLTARGHDVTIATTFDPARSAADIARWRVRQFKVEGRGHALSPYSGELQQYRAFLAQNSYDVMLFHGWESWLTDLALPLLHELPGRKILISHGFKSHRLPHGWVPWRAALEWIARVPYVWRVSESMRRFDQVVFLSRNIVPACAYDYRVAKRIELPQIAIIPNGSNPAHVEHPPHDVRKLWGIQTPLLLLQVARFEIAKDQDFAIRAFLQSGVRDATLVLIGNVLSDYAEDLTRRYRQQIVSGGNRIQLLAGQSPDVIRSAYAAADLYICSSTIEVQSLSVLDAMASATPFISRPVGCHGELPGGLIAETVAEMAAAIRRLCADRDAREDLAALGLQAVREHYSWDVVVLAYDALLTKLAGASPGSVHSNVRP